MMMKKNNNNNKTPVEEEKWMKGGKAHQPSAATITHRETSLYISMFFFLLLYCAVPVLGYAAAIKMNVLGTRYGIGESNNQKC